jgi:hypothetical protein
MFTSRQESTCASLNKVSHYPFRRELLLLFVQKILLVKKNLYKHLYTLYSIQISVQALLADLACAHSQGDSKNVLDS